MKNKIDEKWLAGFFDGEGNIHLRYSKPTYANLRGQYSLWVTVTQSDKDILDDLNILYGGKIYKNKWVKQGKIPYFWRVIGLEAKVFLEAILPYLKLKKEIALIALEFIDTLMPKKSGRRYGLSPELIEKRNKLIERFRELQPMSAAGRKTKIDKASTEDAIKQG